MTCIRCIHWKRESIDSGRCRHDGTERRSWEDCESFEPKLTIIRRPIRERDIEYRDAPVAT